MKIMHSLRTDQYDLLKYHQSSSDFVYNIDDKLKDVEYKPRH